MLQKRNRLSGGARTVDTSKRYYEVKKKAEERGYCFELHKQEFAEFYRLPCTYCGATTTTVNLDRLDNSIGYVIGNVAPCCADCNMMKGTKSLEEWVGKLKLIADRFS